MAFNRFKQHPFVSDLLKDGTLIRYGAKALPEGGWNTIPQTYMDGGLIAGDAGGFLNSMRLKGIHLAMRTGMLAAEAAFESIRDGDTSAASLKRYQDKIDAGPVRAELYPVRNVHQAFGYGLFAGLAFAGFSLATGGRWFENLHGKPGHQRMKMLAWYYGLDVPVSRTSNATTIDRKLTFDKLTNVHYSGTSHDEDQPSHLLVQTEVCSIDLRTGVRPSLRSFLSCERLRDHSRARAARASADQCVQLRALQDVRHHGSLPGDHLGAARGWRRASVQWHVINSQLPNPNSQNGSGFASWELGVGNWELRATGRERMALVVGEEGPGRDDCCARLSADQRARPHTALACRGPRAFRRHRRVRPATGHGLLARPHSDRHVLLPPAWHRRHHQRKLRR